MLGFGKKKKENSKHDKIYLIGILIIFIAGLAIYFFNLLQGHNLYIEKPTADFESYLEDKSKNPFYQFRFLKFAEKISQLAEEKNEAESSEPKEEMLGGVYFTDFFLRDDPVTTYGYINEFWKNINASADVKIKDLHAKNCFDLEILAENRGQTLDKIKSNEYLTELKVLEPPYWQACYSKSYYPEELLKDFTDTELKINNDFRENYIARLEGELTKEESDKIQQIYSDVIKIIE